jgi:hypothetical protein
MKNQTGRTNKIVVIFAVMGFALLLAGCPASPTPNSGNTSNRNAATVPTPLATLTPMICSIGQCTCGTECQDCLVHCGHDGNSNSNGKTNTNANGNANSNANVR